MKAEHQYTNTSLQWLQFIAQNVIFLSNGFVCHKPNLINSKISMKTEHHIFNCITSRICLTDVICTSHCLFKYIRRKQKQYLRNGITTRKFPFCPQNCRCVFCWMKINAALLTSCYNKMGKLDQGCKKPPIFTQCGYRHHKQMDKLILAEVITITKPWSVISTQCR